MYLYLKFDSGTVFNFCLCNQPTGFSVNGSSTPNGLFQTINGLLETAPSTITWCIVPLKIENPEVFVNY